MQARRSQSKASATPGEEDVPSPEILAFYNAEQPANKALIDATVDYRRTGKRSEQMSINMPSLVASQTIGRRVQGKPLLYGGTSPQGERQ